jgi:TPR repeat protein
MLEAIANEFTEVLRVKHDAEAKLVKLFGIGLGAVAIKWYGRAAERGNADAQVNLGNIYTNGTSVVQDYAAATSWYRKAAAQGNAEAQYNLGVVYTEGLGVPRDYAAAASWCRAGLRQGSIQSRGLVRQG